MRRAADLSTQKLLFNDPKPAVFDRRQGNVRQTAIDRAVRKANAVWRERYREFILSFAATATDPFSAEDVREAYHARPGMPKTEKEQSSGGIFLQLKKEGLLREIGQKRSRKFGNQLTSYLRGDK